MTKQNLSGRILSHPRKSVPVSGVSELNGVNTKRRIYFGSAYFRPSATKLGEQRSLPNASILGAMH